MRARPTTFVLLSASVSLSLALPVAAFGQPSSGECLPEVDAPGLAAIGYAVASASAVLETAPTPANFTAAWTDAFASAVRGASGTDGRLSRSEAARLAASGSLYGDNAVNWLEKKAQASVGVEKLIREAAEYAFANGKRVAGPDGRISLADGTKLPKDLQDDYLSLRGKLGGGAEAPSPRAVIESAAKDLYFLSEADARIVYLESAVALTGAIDAQSIRTLLGAQHDVLTTDGSIWFTPGLEYMGIAERTPEVRDVEAFFARMTDPELNVEPERFQTLVDALKGNLTDIHVIRFNQTDDPNVAITSSIFIVGRTASGKLAGVLTGAVET